MTQRPESSNLDFDVRLFAKIHPVLCERCNQSVKSCSSYASWEENDFFDHVACRTESSFSDVDESGGSDLESSSEKDFGAIWTF